jgi:hypothetical protein
VNDSESICLNGAKHILSEIDRIMGLLANRPMASSLLLILKHRLEEWSRLKGASPIETAYAQMTTDVLRHLGIRSNARSDGVWISALQGARVEVVRFLQVFAPKAI